MFGRKKEEPKKKGGGQALMSEMGLMPEDMAGMERMLYGDVENDEELLAELAALQGESPPKQRSPKKVPVAVAELDRMVAESMRDISDSEISDTEDPDLLAELGELTTEDDNYEPPKKSPSPMPPASSRPTDTTALIAERLSGYRTAHEKAKAAGDTSKARRMDRGIKTLQDLLKKATSGRAVSEDDLPPAISVGSGGSSPMDAKHPPSQPPLPVFEPTTSSEPIMPTVQPSAPPPVSPQKPEPQKPTPPPPTQEVTGAAISMSKQDVSNLHMLRTRRDQYKMSAMRAKQSGNGDTAMKYIKIAKQFDKVIAALEEGKPIDLSQMPPPPPGMSATVEAPRELAAAQGSASPTQTESPEQTEPPELNAQDKAKLFKAPESAGSIMEALTQRYEKYKSSADQAKAEGNGSKARRMGRIVKEYEDAIKATRNGKAVNYDDLPVPPGFPPIPVQSSQKPPAPSPNARPPPPAASAGAAHQLSPGQAVPGQRSPQTQKTPPKQPSPIQRQNSLLSRSEKQTMFLQERQLQFKKSAIKAKNNGDMELAKKYLRMAKGFDQMIEASKCGLPVDMGQVPPPPESDLSEDFEFVKATEAQEVDTPKGDRNDLYNTLQQELIQQIRTCTTNAEHFTKLGDVSSASKFQKMSQNARKDLDELKSAYKHGDPVPRFHYETKTFSLVRSCPELGDNDFELTIVRGINFSLPSDYKPSDLDTYVKFELPYPNDDPQKGCSDTQKGTNNPEYNQSFKLSVTRKARSFLRILKNKSMKFEVYYRRGFLKSDKLLGTAAMKLQPLENKCIYHESFDLQDGRKSVGGKLEVKVRIRDPFVNKQVEETKEKWVVIDSYERNLTTKTSAAKPGLSGSGSVPGIQITSMEVLKYEKQLLDKQIQSYQGKISRSDLQVLAHKSKLLQQRIERQKDQLKQGGKPAIQAYITAIEKTKAEYFQEAQALVKQGNREKAQIMLNKKKNVEREVDTYTAYLQRL